MQVAIISGSHRQHSESERIARYLEARLNHLGSEPFVISLAGNPFPLWDEETWSDSARWRDVWGPTSALLKGADACIVVSPEWGGMVPSGLKNFFLLCQSGELAHKPGLIVSVSSGIGGAYPVAELRTSSYKNTRICYIPEHVIVRSCQSMLHDGEPTGEHDAALRERIDYALQILLSYARALGPVRNSGVLESKRFPFGM